MATLRDPFGNGAAPYERHEDAAVVAILKEAKAGRVDPDVAEHEVRVLHWFKRALDASIEPDERDAAAVPLRPADANTLLVPSASAPETSMAAALGAYPRSGTQRVAVLDAIGEAGGRGVTDYEIECLLGLKHQTASATRNGLMRDGWIVDSGQRRPTDSGADAVAWVLSSDGRSQWRAS